MTYSTITGLTKWEVGRSLLFPSSREQQEIMVERTLARVAEGRVAYVEAPTGSGKTALVIPMSARDGCTLLVSHTNTQGAQNLRFAKDCASVGLFDHVGRLMGRNNYLCLRRSAESGFDQIRLPDGAEGTRADVEAAIGRALTDQDWRSMMSDGDEGCSEEYCGSADFYQIARLILNETNALCVTNTSMLALDLLTGGKVLGVGQDNALVLDEAHQAPDAFRDAFAGEVRASQFRRLWKRLNGYDDTGVVAIERFFRDVDETVYMDSAHPLLHTARDWLADVYDLFGEHEDGRVTPIGRRARGLARRLDVVIDGAGDADWVTWVGERDGEKVAVSEKRHVDDLITASLRSAGAAVAMSATLKHCASHVGVDDLIEVGSPFDLEDKRVAVHTTRATKGDRGEQENMDAKVEDLIPLVREKVALGEGTLVLGSSQTRTWLGHRSEIEYVTEALRGEGFKVGLQGETEAPALIQGLKDETYDVIVGKAMLREGVDVPGKRLTQVVLLRLPWKPAGPFEKWVREHEGWGYEKGIMLTNTAQAVGRLIRSETDEGRVVLLDGRPTPTHAFKQVLSPSKVVAL